MVRKPTGRLAAAGAVLAAAWLAGPTAQAAETVYTMQAGLASAPAGVTVHTFTDLLYSRPAFETAAGGTTLVDFNDVDTAPDDYVYYETGFTMGGATFTPLDGELYVTDQNYYYGAVHYGEGKFLELQFGEPNQLKITFAPTHAFAFEFQYLSYPSDPSDKAFGVTFSNGAAFQLTTPNSFSAMSGLSFFGVVSDQAFSSVILDLPDFGAYSLTDNYRIGAPAAAVPEPASWALMIAGFAALGAALRRRATVHPRFSRGPASCANRRPLCSPVPRSSG